ncbi:L-aspartate oxidase [Alicyclobacillus hesperidum URH17-3-68]|uniref:L-aspartate oxidase n=1 Tax=Alicyclobacillus hesperidum TaxID=89784 RepID=A0A1H2R4J3_9BACL|nr:L-aspartate oxidase [Alicyclobacillus hesperidum]EJY55396.1 L-aspartate oxidase [Alicyclobacillus hesperidum URH17-3-68]GLV13186.1 L-aspartate oxidase [Alicyclobacillus hesperidum]SDW14382.1 L-aspartate oxidase [Alicyclobacillus hesperidum]
MNQDTADIVIIGAGLAGMAAALAAAEHSDVVVLSKTGIAGTNSYFAQGGIAASVHPADRAAWHMEDTLAAGAGLSDPAAVRTLTDLAPQAISWLVGTGVSFDRDSKGQLRLGLEGGHGRSRIVHADGDATGRVVVQSLAGALAENGRVRMSTGSFVEAVVKDVSGRAIGVVANCDGETTFWRARKAVVLATGGAGRLYPYSSNPPGAIGEGLALAYHAGAVLGNLEFIQFHPTVVNDGSRDALLISEAVRGAGAQLVDACGKPLFANRSDNLRTRDVVAREIYRAQRERGPVFLDATGVSHFDQRFPNISRRLSEIGIDPITSPIPVTPAAHFMMGGVIARMNGETSVPGLFALGEVACTGVHGANRLASNSLLECVVMAKLFAEAMRDAPCAPRLPEADVESRICAVESEAVLSQVQQAMWNGVGIERTGTGLLAAHHTLLDLARQRPQSAVACVAWLISQLAMAREESRGAHFRSDYPMPKLAFAHSSEIAKSRSTTIRSEETVYGWR